MCLPFALKKERDSYFIITKGGKNFCFFQRKRASLLYFSKEKGKSSGSQIILNTQFSLSNLDLIKCHLLWFLICKMIIAMWFVP
jgi:hypothetical protein